MSGTVFLLVVVNKFNQYSADSFGVKLIVLNPKETFFFSFISSQLPVCASIDEVICFLPTDHFGHVNLI